MAFKDGHLAISDDVRPHGDAPLSPGVGLRAEGERLFVNARMRQWPVPLPELNDELIACDGQPVADLVANHWAPYVELRKATDHYPAAKTAFTIVHSLKSQFKTCVFRSPLGRAQTYSLSYQATELGELIGLLASGNRAGAANGYDYQDGVLWVRLVSFSLNAASADVFEKMLTAIESLPYFHTLVFDVRGNDGGSSTLGDRIFKAATGGIELSEQQQAQLPLAYAQWRVSDYALARIEGSIEFLKAAYGPDNEDLGFYQQLKAAMQAAQAKGEAWVSAGNSYHQWQREAFQEMNIRPKKFSGDLVLLTDNRCASACLDFADTVLAVPGVRHFGQATSGDTLYMEAPAFRLPSGNRLRMPLKVWRGRLRGSNEVYVPDLLIDFNAHTEESLRAHVLKALKDVE
ncbi:S41 family peptidase [Simiduia sp. 21SJ11W-1]|uniref:S41 family peptidase n=1 Tax=Simiduia sp. 21SJ11W-1 TaxID=2909669 RepID=UPI0020A1124E|nr:S41 family peptidase [Simiduia sp. 21SJ11W-1]UTA48388.1 S41 family peptidase [Simiduia sp. 21SJ11W-1]